MIFLLESQITVILLVESYEFIHVNYQVSSLCSRKERNREEMGEGSDEDFKAK